MKLFNRKPKFVYEFSDINNFFDREIKDFNALVTLLEDENYRLNAEGGSSQVTITKINAKKDIIIYSQSFSLPCPEDTDFDSMCQLFLSKKPVSETSQKFVNLPKFDSPSSSMEKENLLEVLVEEPLKEVEKELDPLNEPQNEVTEPITSIEIESSVVDTDDEQVVSEFKANTEALAMPARSFDDEVSGLIETFNQEMQATLADFVSKEKAKIEDEITRLDKRAEIDKRVTDEFEKQEVAEKNSISEAISIARKNAIDEENRRHDKALIEINSSFDNELSDKLDKLKESYQIKIKETISMQYAKETEILSQIFQGKSAELSVRQQSLNQGLQEKFTSSLNQFNKTHQSVISQLKTFHE